MELDYPRMVARVDRNIRILGGAGIPVAWFLWGWLGVPGYLLGALAAWLNFRRLRGLVDSLGGEGGKASWVGFALLYFGIGLAGYVMIKYFGMSILSAFGGLLFVSVGAVLLEVLYTFIYGT
jgi:hypothetical protein